jgi:hypothetical protein
VSGSCATPSPARRAKIDEAVHCWRLMLVVSLAHIADVGSGYVGHSRSVLSAPPEGDPRTVGAERHAVHIGLRGVRLRRVRGRVPQAV